MALLTNLDIVNSACAQIGEDPLSDFDAEIEGAAAASLIYEATVDFNLGLYPAGFSFAKELRPLSRVDQVSAPTSGFDYVYDLPVENVIGLPMYITDAPTDPDARFSRYALISGQVHADATLLWAMVPFRADPHRWSATFRMATITALASKFALSLGHDRGTMESKYVEAYGTNTEMFRGGQMGAAIRAESFSTPPRRQNRDNNPLANARMGG